MKLFQNFLKIRSQSILPQKLSQKYFDEFESIGLKLEV